MNDGRASRPHATFAASARGRGAAVAVLAALAFLPAPMAAQESAVVMNAAEPHVGREPPLRPGDKIKVSSLDEPQLAGEYDVSAEGTVNLPVLGMTDVTGVPGGVLRRRLDAEFGDEFRQKDPVQVTLERRVSILGAVAKPGLYYVDRTMTLADAVALAGGASSDGNWKDVKVLRDGHEIHAHLDQATRVGREIHSDDQIILPQKGWFSRNGSILLGAGVSAVALTLAQLLFIHH